MREQPSNALREAKEKLDRLIKNARSQGLMPITIAEAVRRICNGSASIENIDQIRKASYHWLSEVNLRLFKRGTSLNRSYWDKLYADHMPPEDLAALAAENERNAGVVEAYVYARLRQIADSLRPIRATLTAGLAGAFTLETFLDAFEKNKKLCRSIDKAYEIVVHALFNAIARHLKAEVTLSVKSMDPDILRDFSDFCRLLLGITAERPSITLPARLYRVGGTNSRDGGVDLWANFGPAVQVKHISLDPDQVPAIVDRIGADHVVIVCRDAEKDAIAAVLTQFGMFDRVRGIITRADLIRWYALALGPKHRTSIAKSLFAALLAEFDDEFSLADPTTIDAFTTERGYGTVVLDGMWSVDEPLKSPPKPKKNKNRTN